MVDFSPNISFRDKLLILLFFPYTLYIAVKSQIVSRSWAFFWFLLFLIFLILNLQLGYSKELQKYLPVIYLMFNVLTFNFIEAIKNIKNQAYLMTIGTLVLFIALVNWKIIIEFGVSQYIENYQYNFEIDKIQYMSVFLIIYVVSNFCFYRYKK